MKGDTELLNFTEGKHKADSELAFLLTILSLWDVGADESTNSRGQFSKHFGASSSTLLNLIQNWGRG